jgi:isopenicillin N synthase-like dioxygenase
MLPIIDISDLNSDDIARRRRVADALGEAYGRAGFAYIANHGVGQDTIDAVLDGMRAFFDQPEARKRELTRRRGVYRGYIPVMPFGTNPGDTPPPLYEAFIVGEDADPADPEVAATGGLFGPNVWPDEPAGFRAAVTAYWHAVSGVSNRMLRAFALALDQDEDVLLRKFVKPLTNISLLHYLPRPGTEDHPDDDLKGHRDTNAITVLLPSAVGGLEVAAPEGGWMQAPPEPGCFIVNIGNMMECWSGGRLKSTMHRVHPPRDKHRYSIGYFAVPDYNTVVEPLPGLPVTGTPDDMAPRHAGHDLAGFVAQFDNDASASAPAS